MTDNARYQVGLVGLPALAEALADAGMRVATGPDFRAAAAAVTMASRVAPVPLLIADVAAPGTTPWLEKVLRTAPGALVQVPLPEGATRVGGGTAHVPRVELPVTLGELLSVVGLRAPGTLSGCEVLADATLLGNGATVEPADRRGDESDDIDDEPASDDIDEPDDEDEPDEPVAELPAAPPAGYFPPAPPAAAVTAPEVARPAVPAPVRVQDAPPLAPPARTRPTGPVPHLDRSLAVPVKRGKLVMTLAGKGGVGKSTLAMVLAQRAAEVAGLKVAVVDGNRGQGDLRTYLRLNRASLPSVYDVATGADPSDAVVTPDRLAAVRPPGSDPLSFAIVLAPPSGLASRADVGSKVYAQVVEHLRGTADLVVVDTQIIESSDTSGLFDELWVPSLVADAYAVGLSDLSTPGLRNLMERLQDLTGRGVPTERLFTMLNRVPPSVSFDEQTAGDSFARFSHYVGRARADDQVIETMGHGTLPWRTGEMPALADRVLLHVTGDPRFTQQPTAAPAAGNRWRLPFLRGRA